MLHEQPFVTDVVDVTAVVVVVAGGVFLKHLGLI